MSSMDGVRDDRTKRSQGERPRTGESHHFIPVNSFTNRLTDLGNQLVIIKGKREGKGDVKRLGLTDTFLILLLAQGNLLNTVITYMGREEKDTHACIPQSWSCSPETNTSEINAAPIEIKNYITKRRKKLRVGKCCPLVVSFGNYSGKTCAHGQLTLIAQLGKNPPAMPDTPVQFLGREDPLEKGLGYPLQYSWASLVAQLVKNPPAMRETWV